MPVPDEPELTRHEPAARDELRLRPELRGVRAAVVFLTRIPVGGFPYSQAEKTWSAAHFPLVGALLGSLLALALYLLDPAGPFAAAILVMGLSLLLTGAFHEDGLADSADALGGGFTRERVLEILKDSRVGSFGAAALVVSIAGRAALLATLLAKSRAHALWALPLVHCAARLGPVWLMRFMPYATPPDLARSRDVAGAGSAQAWVATAWLVLALVIVIPLSPFGAGRALILCLTLAAVCAICAQRFHARLGGVTGDFLGATEQLCELTALTVLVWR